MSIKASVKDTTSDLLKVKPLWFAFLFAENDIHQMTNMTMGSQRCHGWRLHKELRTEITGTVINRDEKRAAEVIMGNRTSNGTLRLCSSAVARTPLRILFANAKVSNEG